ncbi:MAG: NAD(P)H-dependent oxidoreductase [Trueperaceae bacterium]|nr:NAD(P)H-dependent oxidoreductase [Trueperaceae bacterium]
MDTAASLSSASNPQQAPRLAVILGSTREGRFCDTVASWVMERIGTEGAFVADLIDPAALDLPNAYSREPHPALIALSGRLAAADAFLVVVPEYNHSYPSALKFLIDAFGEEWYTKPVAFVSYGGISGGLRAVEHLRGVFAELHAVGVRDGVSFANARRLFEPDGRLRDPAEAEKAFGLMSRRLLWWTTALRDARAAMPY